MNVTIINQTESYSLPVFSSYDALKNQKSAKCVIYNGRYNGEFYIPYKELLKVFRSISKEYIYNTILHCRDERGIEYRVLVKRIQFHPVTDQILHIEFYLINEDSKDDLIVPVPLTLKNVKQHPLVSALKKPLVQVLKNIRVKIGREEDMIKDIYIDMANVTFKKYRIHHLMEEIEIRIGNINQMYTIAKIK